MTFKYKLRLNNVIGIIDGDYFHSDNEGHIFLKISNENNDGKTVSIEKGQGFAQGIFVPYGITFDDDCIKERNGCFGSTDEEQINMYIYEGHMGCLFVNNEVLSYDELYCEQCGDSDSLLGHAETREEAWNILKPITDINNSGGWDYSYVHKFLDEYFGEE